MKIFLVLNSCSGVTWRLNNSTPIACSSARMRRLNAGCETLRNLLPPGKNCGIFPGSENHKAIWFRLRKTAPQSSITFYSVSRPCGHSMLILGRLTTVYAVSNVPFTRLAVFDHQFAASVYLLMRNSGVMTRVCVIAWQKFAFPRQVKETGYATGEAGAGHRRQLNHSL